MHAQNGRSWARPRWEWLRRERAMGITSPSVGRDADASASAPCNPCPPRGGQNSWRRATPGIAILVFAASERSERFICLGKVWFICSCVWARGDSHPLGKACFPASKCAWHSRKNSILTLQSKESRSPCLSLFRCFSSTPHDVLHCTFRRFPHSQVLPKQTDTRHCKHITTERQTGRQAGGQADRQTAFRQAGRQVDRQTDTHTDARMHGRMNARTQLRCRDS